MAKPRYTPLHLGLWLLSLLVIATVGFMFGRWCGEEHYRELAGRLSGRGPRPRHAPEKLPAAALLTPRPREDTARTVVLSVSDNPTFMTEKSIEGGGSFSTGSLATTDESRLGGDTDPTVDPTTETMEHMSSTAEDLVRITEISTTDKTVTEEKTLRINTVDTLESMTSDIPDPQGQTSEVEQASTTEKTQGSLSITASTEASSEDPVRAETERSTFRWSPAVDLKQESTTESLIQTWGTDGARETTTGDPIETTTRASTTDWAHRVTTEFEMTQTSTTEGGRGTTTDIMGRATTEVNVETSSTEEAKETTAESSLSHISTTEGTIGTVEDYFQTLTLRTVDPEVTTSTTESVLSTSTDSIISSTTDNESGSLISVGKAGTVTEIDTTSTSSTEEPINTSDKENVYSTVEGMPQKKTTSEVSATIRTTELPEEMLAEGGVWREGRPVMKALREEEAQAQRSLHRMLLFMREFLRRTEGLLDQSFQ